MDAYCTLTADELRTASNATLTGFKLQAIAKRSQANPYLDAARQFKGKLSDINQVDTLIARLHADPELRESLIAAAGFSQKSMKHVAAELDGELDVFLRDIFTRFTKPEEVCEELVYRYLLTKGDSLGGQIRNWIGSEAKQKFSKAVLSSLESKGYKLLSQAPTQTAQIIRGIAWRDRVLLFDVTPKAITEIQPVSQKGSSPQSSQRRHNNVDVILLRVPDSTIEQGSSKKVIDQLRSGDLYTIYTNDFKVPPSYRKLLEQPQYLRACGELKGGIDPAGADEHWKTAVSALGPRIRQRFNLPDLKLFFVGAAIEMSMAHEIVAEIARGELSFAANLTNPEQVSALAEWLITL